MLSLLLLMVSMKASAYIAVENEDGVTIYYNYINDKLELEVTYGFPEYSGIVKIPESVIILKL